MSCRSSLLACLLLLSSSLACSEAETPNAQFDGGVPSEAPFDAGPGFGSRDEPCASGRCESNDLVCVSESIQGGGTENICRFRCDVDATDDPCGLGSTCGLLQNDQGACLPAGGLDGDCPCDEGFSCALLPQGDGGNASICKRTCALEGPDGGVLDAGPDAVAACPGSQVCRRLQGSDNLGVCLDD